MVPGSRQQRENDGCTRGDRFGHRAAKQEGDKVSKISRVLHGNNVISVQLLEVPLLGVGAVLGLERDACSMVK